MALTIEEEFTNNISACFPGDMSFDAPDDYRDAVMRAKSVSDVLLDISAHEQDIYYAFLKKETGFEGYELLGDKDESIKNSKIIMDMWHNHLDYEKIIRCMTYAPMFLGKSKEERWQSAVAIVSANLNPMLSFPHISDAKPLFAVNAYGDPGEVYGSYLKAVLTGNPRMSVIDADKEIVRLMHKSGILPETINGVIGQSVQFLIPLENKDGSKSINQVPNSEEFIQDAIKSLYDDDVSHTEVTDDEVYQKMHDRLLSMKPQHEFGDSFDYWQQAISVMKETMVHLNRLHSMSRVLNLWSIGIERASQELDIEIHPEIKQVQLKLKSLQQAVGDEEEGWREFWTLCAKVESFSRSLFKHFEDIKITNPLMRLPEVQHARPLKEVLDEIPPDYQKLYFGALREVVQGNPGITQDEADMLVISDLIHAGKEAYDTMLAITNSPCLKSLTKAQQLGAAQQMVQSAQESKTRQCGGGRS